MRASWSALALATILFGALVGPIHAASQPGVAPVAIRVPVAKVNAPVVPAAITNGVPDEPRCASAVSWYQDTGRLGVAGNVVMVGANDWPGKVPAVFARLGNLKVGDAIEVVGDNGKIYRFLVESVHSYAKRADAPLAEIFQTPAKAKLLTMFTGDGAFDQTTNSYEGLLVAMAKRTSQKAETPGTSIAAASPSPIPTPDPRCVAS